VPAEAFERLETESSPAVEKASGVGRGADNWCQWAIREGDWKLYADADAKRVELYDVSQDRAETTDVGKDNPGVVRRMKSRLLEWVASLPTSPDESCVSKGERPTPMKRGNPRE